MYCTKCGAKLPHDARFCMNCGKPVSAIASAKAVELKASPANAAVPTKVVEPAGVSAKTTVPAAASAKAAASTAAPAKEAAPSASSRGRPPHPQPRLRRPLCRRLRRKRRTRAGMMPRQAMPRQAAILQTLLRKMIPHASVPCKAISHSAIPRSKAPLLWMSPKSHARPAYATRLRRLKTAPRQSTPKPCVAQ